MGLIRQYFTDGHLVLIRGIPSVQEATRLDEEEKARIEARKQQIGEEGLKMWHDRVEEAKKTNEVLKLLLISDIAFSRMMVLKVRWSLAD